VGLFPLYWPLLEPAAPVEILAHRIVWSLVFLALVLAVSAHGYGYVRRLGRRRLGLLALAALLITVNWGTFIHGVNSGHVVETSLGYFMNPLVSVALGVGLLGERLRSAQGWAVGIGALAVPSSPSTTGARRGSRSILAFSFGLYGLVKKHVGRRRHAEPGGRDRAAPAARAGYLAYLGATGAGRSPPRAPATRRSSPRAGSPPRSPLMLFGAAANRLPLSTLGVLQYIGPTMHFGIGRRRSTASRCRPSAWPGSRSSGSPWPSSPSTSCGPSRRARAAAGARPGEPEPVPA
jgi:chloramphenicol-sensitive protein RarD